MAATPGVRGVHPADRRSPTPSNYRATRHLDALAQARAASSGSAGIDTRALTSLIREQGHAQRGDRARAGRPLRPRRAQEGGARVAGPGRHGPRADGDHRRSASPGTRRRGNGARATAGRTSREFHVVAIDYGIKRNILRLLAGNGCKVTVVPATTSAEDILALKPDGVFLSNGPGDPAATGEYAVPVIQSIIDKGMPTFGICLGHQMLGIAVGAKTMKMHQGHHGANHPVKDLDHRQGRDHLDEPRLRGRPRDACRRTRRRRTSRCSTARTAASRSRTGRCSRCSTTPRPRPARATATICSSASSR